MGQALRAAPQLFDQWRQADAAARAAEKDVLTASFEALDGKGGPPSIEDRTRAKRLRVAADEMLNAALVSLQIERPLKGEPVGPESHAGDDSGRSSRTPIEPDTLPGDC